MWTVEHRGKLGCRGQPERAHWSLTQPLQLLIPASPKLCPSDANGLVSAHLGEPAEAASRAQTFRFIAEPKEPPVNILAPVHRPESPGHSVPAGQRAEVPAPTRRLNLGPDRLRDTHLQWWPRSYGLSPAIPNVPPSGNALADTPGIMFDRLPGVQLTHQSHRQRR